MGLAWSELVGMGLNRSSELWIDACDRSCGSVLWIGDRSCGSMLVIGAVDRSYGSELWIGAMDRS